MSSQFTISAPVTCTAPSIAPLSDSANTIGFFESLCVQTTPGVRALNAMPLASGTFCSWTGGPSMVHSVAVRLVRAESVLVVPDDESGTLALRSTGLLQDAVAANVISTSALERIMAAEGLRGDWGCRLFFAKEASTRLNTR